MQNPDREDLGYSFKMMVIVLGLLMLRKSRMDAPGALHHIIARSIERCKVFRDDADCNNFLDCPGGIIDDTGTVRSALPGCLYVRRLNYSWCLFTRK